MTDVVTAYGSPIRFVRADEDDIPRLAELCLAACQKKTYGRLRQHDKLDPELYLAKRRARLLDDFQDASFVAFVAQNKRNGNDDCGMLSLFLPDAQGMGYIQDLYAVSGGLTGTSGLIYAKEFLKKNDARAVQLQANPDAVPFYERKGFRNVSANDGFYLMECAL